MYSRVVIHMLSNPLMVSLTVLLLSNFIHIYIMALYRSVSAYFILYSNSPISQSNLIFLYQILCLISFTLYFITILLNCFIEYSFSFVFTFTFLFIFLLLLLQYTFIIINLLYNMGTTNLIFFIFTIAIFVRLIIFSFVIISNQETYNINGLGRIFVHLLHKLRLVLF